MRFYLGSGWVTRARSSKMPTEPLLLCSSKAALTWKKVHCPFIRRLKHCVRVISSVEERKTADVRARVMSHAPRTRCRSCHLNVRKQQNTFRYERDKLAANTTKRTCNTWQGTAAHQRCRRAGGTLSNHSTLQLLMAKDDNGDGGLTKEKDCCQHSLSRKDGRGVVISELSQKKYRGATEHKNLRSRRIDYFYFW